MLSFFRRIINSKLGVIVTFIVLGVIALAFAAGDVSGIRSSGIASLGGGGGGGVASVGKASIGDAEVKTRAQTEMDGYRQQQPTLDMAQFVAGGGLEGTIERLITGMAFDAFGADHGIVVSKKMIDGQIASIPALQGPNGKFDPALFQRILADRKLTEASLRTDIGRETMGQQLTLPTIGASQVPAELALPYASLLLEKRAGVIGFIPTRALGAGAAPTDAELTTYYQRNIARYTVPERRIARYAMVTSEQVKAKATPTEAEIAQSYKTDAAKYAATEKRDIVQVVVADRAGATALAAKVKGGTAIEAAARATGLEPSVQKGTEKAAYTLLTSPAIADAAFAAAKGSVIGPLKSPLGWTVARIDSIEQVAGKSLDQARPGIVTALTQQKAVAALSAIHDAIDDSLSDRATFDEIVADQKLTAAVTPPLTATGVNPDDPAAKPDPALAQVVAGAFAAEEGDTPQMVQTAADGGFAVVALGRVVPAAPRPLAQAREAVARDFVIDRARRAARQVAVAIVAKVNKGMAIPQALTETKLKLPPAQPLGADRAQLAANPQGAPPPLALMFSMAQGTAKLLEAPNNGGWFVIKLDRIVPGNAAGNAGVISATRADIGKMVGREYVEQFSKAVRGEVGVKKNAAAIARVRADLLGQGGSNN